MQIIMKLSYIKYILALVLFGSNGIVASLIALKGYEIVFFRTLIGSVFLILLFALTKKKRNFMQNKKHSAWLAVSGIAMGVSWVLLFEAYQLIGVSLSTLAYYCGPILVMVLSPILFHEKLTAAMIIGFAIVIGGVVLINGIDVIHTGFSAGLIFGLLAAAMYAVMVICNKKASSITGLENAMWQLTISCVIVAVFSITVNKGCFVIPHESIPPLLFLGLVNTGLGCYFYFSSISYLSAQTVSICGYLKPLSALLLSALLLSERLTGIQIIGAVLLLGGAVLGEAFKGNKLPLAEKQHIKRTLSDKI